jgi:cation:H+ antiporter
MLIATGLALLGLALLLTGAELLTRGGGDVAARLGISPIVIGLTVVAIGTSAPELAVGIDAALQGNGALAVGNIAGTNTVNLLLIFGLSAMLRPLPLRLQTVRMDLPAMVAAAMAVWAMCWDGNLSRSDGVVLMVAGVAYTLLVIYLARRESLAASAAFSEQYKPMAAPPGRGVLGAVAMLGGGIAVIVYGAHLFVEGTVALARVWGVSDAFIGLTVVAIGTSSPELVTTLVSTLRGQRDIGIGNLLGSSIYNLVFILGTTSVVSASLPVPQELIRIDIPVMVVVTIACVPVFLTRRNVSRMEGALFTSAYVAYLAYLLVART